MKNVLTRSAFTLVELAIVLVIIGLIVGGVLVGQDLIHTAQIRSVITDIEKYNAAASTFREKYTGLPGDLLNTKAVQFGFNNAANDAARDGTAGRGDGDGQIKWCDAQVSGMRLSCETVLFWSDLGMAHLASFNSKYTSTTANNDNMAMPADLGTAGLADGVLPKTRLRDTALVAVFSLQGASHFIIAELNTDLAGDYLVNLPYGQVRGITPLEARGIDQKLDDGTPMMGIMISLMNDGSIVPDEAGSANNCMNATGENYNTATDVLANTDACAISIRASF